jgi:2-oxoglutarate ferredoxin oxidoreductase subunit beta
VVKQNGAAQLRTLITAEDGIHSARLMPIRHDDGTPITASYTPGEGTDDTQHDGSMLRMHKLHAGHDLTDRVAALNSLARHRGIGEIVTGLPSIEVHQDALRDHLGTVATPLTRLDDAALCPGAAAREQTNAALR